MSKPRHTLTSLLSRLGVTGPACLHVSPGIGARKIARGSGVPSFSVSRVRGVFLLALGAMLGALALAASPAGAAETRRELGTFGGASSSVVDPYPLSDPQGVAADKETEDVYVADTGNHRVEKFSVTGQFLLAFGGNVGGLGTDVCGGLVACGAGSEGSTPGDLTTPKFVAVDNDSGSASYHDVYVADTADNVVSKFSEKGKLEETWGVEGQLSGGCEKPGESAPCSGSKVVPFGPIAGLAVGSTGTLDVMNTGGGVFEFEPSSKSLSAELHLVFEYVGSYPVGLGVNSAGDFFRNNENGTEIEEYGPMGGVVSSLPSVYLTSFEGGITITALTVDSNGELYYTNANGALRHDAFNGAGEVLYPGGGTCSSECAASDSIGVGFAASGIAVAAGTGDTFLSNAGAGTVYQYGPLVTAIRPEEPRSEQAVEANAASAKLQGELNASSVGEPESGTYEFLYRPSATSCEGGKATPAAPAAAKRGEMVSAVVGELLPGTVYAFCLRVTNGAGEAATGAPVSFTTGVAVPGVGGLSVSNVAATSATLDASVDPGGGVTSCVFEYAPVGGVFAPAPGADAAGVVAEGAQSVPVGFHVQGLRAGTVYEFRVSVTNSAGSSVSEEPLSFTTQLATGAFGLPDGREWELVSQPDKYGALIQPIASEGLVQASVNGDAITYAATAATESEPQGFSGLEQVFSSRGVGGASSWVSRDITPPSEQVAPQSVGEGEEYQAFSEDLSLAVVQPHGPFRPFLSPEASEQTAYLHTLYLNGDVNDPCVQSCYRPLVTGKPGYANVPPGTVFGETEGDKCPPATVCGPDFRGATPDLSHIALQSSVSLVAGSGSGEYEWVDGQLSPGNNVPGPRESTSEDGSWSYSQSENSLYVSHGGVTKLIAAGLSAEDARHDLAGAGSRSTSRVSPDGRWFAFMSNEELTGYDNRDAVSGEPDEEVYLYHAPDNLATETGTLVCASCNPTGARPVGAEYGQIFKNSVASPVSGYSVWEDQQWIAANVPGWTPYQSGGSAIYQSRYLSDSGRLFFNSDDALVPKDVNGTEDVYEYEPVGDGSCTTSTSTGSSMYMSARGGCVSLISSGQDGKESGFLDASGSGGDVFFVTAAKLVSQDYDTAFDVYDAHECTSAAPSSAPSVAAPPPCDTGDACKAAPTPQPTIFSAPPSATFSGPGNITGGRELNPPPRKKVTKKTVKCKKGFVKNRHDNCVKRSKKAAKKAKRASNERRASR
jgi:hypothetical protein